MTRSEGTTSPKSGVLAKALTLFELVATQQGGIGVREAARRTKVDRSAVSRIFTQFEEMGYIEQESDRGVYQAGPRLFSLVASLSQRDSLAKAAEPFLHEIVDRFNETCYLAVRVDHQLVFRNKVDCNHTIRYVIEMGKPFPLVSGASGLAILSGLTDEELGRVLLEPIEATTAESFTRPEDVLAQLSRDRELGYTYSPGRWVPNGAGIAAPFYDAAGRCVGAIALSCPADRLVLSSVDEIGQAVKDAASRMSARLGQI